MTLTEATLLDDVRQRLFSPTRSASPRTVGAELELIPVDSVTRKVVSAREGTRSTAAVLSRLAAREGWTEQRTDDDPPSWTLSDGARISFEPGGQIEISSAPHATATPLIKAVRRVAGTIEREMIASGVTLVARGVDPYNDIATVPLQLRRDRYVRMTEYFDSIGPSGVRMMRQTAALQINVERGEDPLSRWLLLNAMTPVVVALFASSSRYAGSETGFASFRSQLWRTLDPSRTGIAYGAADPARHYLDFALDAVAMRSGGKGRSYLSFRDWMLTGETTVEDWHFHLSTLFPEVRSKEYFELRSADTIEIEWLAAPIVFVTGLVYDPAAAGEAMSLLGAPSPDLLERAGRLGLRDPELRTLALRLTHLAVQGAETAGADYIENDHVQTARAYFARALDAS